MRQVRINRLTLAPAVLAICVFSWALPAMGDESSATESATTDTAPVEPSLPGLSDELRQRALDNVIEYYARTYGAPLKSEDALPSLIAITSLNRIDAPAITELLMEGLSRKHPMVQLACWESLLARLETLSDVQRAQWSLAGLKLAADRSVPLSFKPIMLQAGVHADVSKDPRLLPKLLDDLIDVADPTTEPGRKLMQATGELLAAHVDRRLLARVRSDLRSTKSRDAAAIVLRQLPGAPTTDDPIELIKWLESVNVESLRTEPSFSGSSRFFDPPIKIDDPNDPRWRGELEIDKLIVTDLDLVWVIDSTGSMAEPNLQVAASTERVMKMLGGISERVRCAAVYVRHEVDEQLMRDCCVEALRTNGAYQTKGYALTPDIARLSQTINAEDIPLPGKAPVNMHPGTALHGGMYTAVAKMSWSRDKNARKVIVMVGDSFPTPDSIEAARKLMTEAIEAGFIIKAFTFGDAAREWAPILQAGAIEPIVAERSKQPDEKAWQALAESVLQTIVGPDYADHLEQIMPMLLEFAEQ